MLKIATLLIILNLATARKTYLVKTESNLQNQPRVQAIKYDWSRCPYADDTNSICFDIDVNTELGWAWYQEFIADTRYRLRLEIYIK